MKRIIPVQFQNLYVVIPVFEHDRQLKEVIASLNKNGLNNIIVVDDGSEKTIFPEISEFKLHFLRHRQNLGQGAALQTGFDLAKSLDAEIVVSFDADGQHDPADIPQLIQPILAGRADICMGSRFLSRQPTNIPYSKKLLLQTARYFNAIFTGIRLTDAHNGLRAINRKALNTIRITENRMAHATEILIEAKKNQLRVVEVPVTIHYTPYSKKYGQSSWNSIRILIDLALYKLFS